MTKRLRQRNQAAVGLASLVLLVAAILLAFFSKSLPVIGSGTSYSAHFAESAGLSSGDDVQLAGVKVGEVTKVELDGNRILVDFRVEDTRLGDRTRVSIQIKTLLGAKYLALRPEGSEELDPGKVIPMSRTNVPFEIPDALDKLTKTTEKIDTKQLARSFHVMSESLSNSPEKLGKTVDGLSKLSQTIASRDEQLASLLHNAGDVSQIAADRDQEVRKLISDGNLLLSEVQRRKESISSLLRGTQELSDEVRGLIADNQAQLQPTLEELDKVTSMLKRNQQNLGKTIAAMEPYITGFNNTVGTGRWFDGYLCGLLPPSVSAGPLEINPKGCDLTAPSGETGGGR